MIRNGVIVTSKGRYLDLVNCRPGDFDIEEIAQGLSAEPRFGGALTKVLVVAQHSVNTSIALDPHGDDPLMGMAGLLHDATEGVGLKDLPTPIKMLFPDYVRLEHVVGGKIALQYGLNVAAFEHPTLKMVDGLMCALEAKELHPAPETIYPWCGGRPDDIDIRNIDPNFFVWDHTLAQMRFLARFYQLKERMPK